MHSGERSPAPCTAFMVRGAPLATALALLWSLAGGPIHARPPARMALLAVNETGFTFELTLPEPAVQIDRSGPSECQRVVPARLDDPPGLEPAGTAGYGWLIGLPEPGAASVEVLDVESRRRTVRDLCPAKPGDRPWADRPGQVASVEDAGWLRDRPVARLQITPVEQVAPDQVLVRTRVKAQVHITAGAARIGRTVPGVEAAPFDAIAARALLNGTTLPPVRVLGRARAPSAGDVVSNQNDLAADPTALKILVNRNGPIALTGADLAAAGWDLATVNPASLAIEAGGTGQALALYGTADGRLDPQDSVSFQGRAMTGEYTRENVFWLHQGGGGLRHGGRSGAPLGAPPDAVAFTNTLHFEEDTLYEMNLPASEGDDRWLWGNRLNAGEMRNETLTVPNALPGATAHLRLRLQGFTDDQRVDPDHHLRLRLNGQPIYDGTFDRRGVQVIDTQVEPGVLVAGANTLVLHNVGDTGAFADALYLNWIDVTYAASYHTTNDRLDFAAPAAGRFAFTLDGFSLPEVTVLDISDPARPVRISGLGITAAGDGRYQVTFVDTAQTQTRYVAYSAAGVERPVRIETNHPSRLRAATRGADYVVITHPDFELALEPLVRHRSERGLRVATVRIDDVYDEFAYGVFDPRAIRAFLKFAFATWIRPAPTFVLLVGDGNLDYRGGYKSGPPNFVPSMQVELDVGGAVTSDTWFAALDEDVLPELLLGRISTSTPAEVEAVVDKIIRYETGPPRGGWRQQTIMVVDDDDSAAFEPAADRLIARMPPATRSQRFYAARYPRERDLTADLMAAIERGALAVNYIGHGHVSMWSSWPGGGSMFQNGNIAQLSNREFLPVLTTATCLNGWFTHPLLPVSMAEIWLTHPDGGGIAAWSPAGLTTLPGQEALLGSFYAGLFDDRHQPIGALTTEAGALAYGQSAAWADLVRMFVLLGDPATVVTGARGAVTYLPLAQKNRQPGRR